MARSVAGGMGGFLPNPLAEVWEPSRDFAHLKLPTSGVRCVVALSGYVKVSMTMLRGYAAYPQCNLGQCHMLWSSRPKAISTLIISTSRTAGNAL